jgi:ribonuclease P protein component
MPGFSETASSAGPPPKRATLARSRRLAHDLEYQAVYDAKMRKSAGPLTVFSMPNGRTFHRLGLAVGKRVGIATARTREKRMIREAFRMFQHEFPRGADGCGYDLVVSSRAHERMTLEEFQRSLREAVIAGHEAWARRRGRKSPTGDANTRGGA